LSSTLSLTVSRWYAWHLFPGYCHAPYVSPIWVRRVETTGPGKVSLAFFNAFEAEGEAEASLELNLLKAGREYWVGEVAYPNNPALDRIAAITPISFSWMYAQALDFISAHPPRSVNEVEEDIQAYLDREAGFWGR
jgi:hypothetical protein